MPGCGRYAHLLERLRKNISFEFGIIASFSQQVETLTALSLTALFFTALFCRCGRYAHLLEKLDKDISGRENWAGDIIRCHPDIMPPRHYGAAYSVPTAGGVESLNTKYISVFYK